MNRTLCKILGSHWNVKSYFVNSTHVKLRDMSLRKKTRWMNEHITHFGPNFNFNFNFLHLEISQSEIVIQQI